MSFDNHLFISYAHIDDIPLSVEQDGWVSQFHKDLWGMLTRKLGRKATIWRDPKLNGTDRFESRIVAQFAHSALLLSIVSPRYLESEWCQRELKEFCEIAERQEGLTISDRFRLIKVVKSPPFSDQTLPAIMRQMLGYDFYEISDDETPVELDPLFGKQYKEKYYAKLNKLAWELSKTLREMERGVLSPAQDAIEAPVPTVYLAECSYDQRDVREALDAELKARGYRILPESPLARDESTFLLQVEQCLRQSQLAIHLVGANYGAVPDGPSQKSIIVLQNELAIRICREQTLPRIIWMPESARSRSTAHNEFVTLLETDPETQFGADLITDDNPETIKTSITAALSKLQNTPEPPPVPVPGAVNRLIYVPCTVGDRRNLKELLQQLRALGYETELPAFEGSAEEMRAANQALMQQCAAIVIFYGSGTEAWKLSVRNEIRKVLGLGQLQGGVPVFTYLAAPSTETKLMIADVETNIIDALNGLTPEALAPLHRAIQAGAR
ncbi:TIR domain-containing protein [Terriglobus roseus]|uniref:TIR domain-containing protein n=1 Tax=Terriglobus roseus TaxID=392734 RepID=A0A1H4K2T1_9BACT|nr:TIR domain-containing protein [Terriglobus roseus]SEB52415.1 TIR domain-containing protein [Terriglobus roseus]